jgi:hypothetical protein
VISAIVNTVSAHDRYFSDLEGSPQGTEDDDFICEDNSQEEEWKEDNHDDFGDDKEEDEERQDTRTNKPLKLSSPMACHAELERFRRMSLESLLNYFLCTRM